MYNFDAPLNRYNTEVIKWDRLASDYGKEGLLPFGIADMDFKVLPELHEAMVKRADHETYGYTYASQKYYDSFIAWNKTRNNFEVKKEEMMSVPGIVCAVSFIIHALTEKGDKVLLNTPIYDPFFAVLRQHGRTMLTSSMVRNGDRYEMNFADIEEKMKEGVKLFILCNPHNPVGRVWTKEELEKLVDLCDKYNVYLFSDEIHSDLIFPGHKHLPIYNASPKAEKLALLAMAPSKTFNVAGLKSSILVAKDPDIRKKVNDAITAFHIGVNLFGLKATEVCYAKGAAWADELLVYLYDNAKAVVDFVEKNMPKVKTYVPEGTYLMWLDFSAYGLSQEELMKKMVNEAGVALNDGEHYGPEGKGFVRLNIGTQRAMLMQGLEQIKKAFED